MTKDQERRVIDIYGPGRDVQQGEEKYGLVDIPTIIRQRDAKKSEADQRKADDLRQEETKN